MARDVATTKETGGGGFAFADKVAAWFLLQMLRRTMVLGPESGVITEVQFETRANGWLLDDLLLVLHHNSGPVRCAVSIKSDTKLSKNGLDSEFMSDVWEQWRGVSGSTFDPSRDYLGLATGGASDSVLLSWSELHNQAGSTSADRLVGRLTALSAMQSKMFESVLPTGTQATETTVRVEAARLLGRLKVFNFDFEFAPSADEGEAIRQSAECTTSETVERGVQLWKLLEGVAAKSRTTGASVPILQLVGMVRGAVEIKDYPDHRADWEKIEKRSQANLAEIRTVVGENIRIERDEERKMVVDGLRESRAVAIVGESGSGKSALLSDVLRTGGAFDRVMWLKPEQLTQASEPDLTASLGLRYSLGTLMEGSARTRGILVLDSFERFEGHARARALELVRAVFEKEAPCWRVVVTTQRPNWLETRRALLGTGLKDVKVLAFAKPKPEQIASKLGGAPGVSRLFRRRELQSILCNLAVLHWVVNTERLHPFDEGRTWVGEAELIGWIWEHWRGQTRDKYRRDALLRLIGEQEGERVSGAAALETIPSTELAILRDLEQDGVVRVTESSVAFSHDLIGDWARFRSLLAVGDDVSARIRERVVVPRWARAVRLYAQGLAERQDRLAKWKTGLGDPSANDVQSALTKDLFLDGIVFAANVEPLLEETWPELIAEKGKLLSRLLARLAYAGTAPDWRMKEEVEPEDADLATAWFRVPNPMYWVPILRVLASHAEDVAKSASFQAAKALELWLRVIPPTWPGRKEAAMVALELARELQGILAEGVIVLDEIDVPIYQALLQAAPEFPEEVSELALELAGRRPESERVHGRRATAQARQAAERAAREISRKPSREKRARPPIFIPPPGASYGTVPSPAPDGPRRRVERGFRSAVLDGLALNGLVITRPEVAREVLLAACLEAPRESDREGPFTIPGFAYWPSGHSPMYWKGPFGNFLKLAPKDGLDTILRLVNYATKQWLWMAAREDVPPEELRRFGVEVSLSDKTAIWLGNFEAFGWYRNTPGAPQVVACALMALEKWLYELMDGGESVDAAVEQIYQQNRSLALGGVLIAAGLKHPAKFSGILQPMLGSLPLYFFQVALSQQDVDRLWSIGMVGWGDMGKKAFQMAQSWHELEHRTSLLQNEAVRLMLTDKSTAEYIQRRKTEWHRMALEARGEDRERLEFFLAKFDPANYTTVQLEDGSQGFEGKLPAHLEARANEKSRELGLNQLAFTLPRLARECLSGEKRIAQDRVGSFFEKVQLLSGHREDDKEFLGDAAKAGVLGGIAVLLIDHRDWLRSRPDAEQWCLETLRAYGSHPAWELTGEHDIYTMAPEGFFGEACVALLAELSEEWVKRGAVRGATAFQYQATAFVMGTAYRFRTKLGDDFSKLCNVIVMWAALRRASAEALFSDTHPGVLAKCRNLLVTRFVNGKIGKVRIPLSKADRLGTRLIRDAVRKNRPWELENAARREADGRVSRRSAGLDLEVLRLGFAFLTVESGLPAGPEREEFLERCKEFLDFELSMIPKVVDDSDTRGHGPIYDFDQWVFAFVGRVLCSDVSALTRESFWRPLLERGLAGADWIDEFLMQFFRVALSGVADQKRVAAAWKEMIAFARQAPEWAPKSDRNWYRRETLSNNLMGLGYTARVLGLALNRALVETMQPEYQQWANAWLTHSQSAVAFGYFLASESGSVLLPVGLVDLARAMRSFRDYEWRQERVADSLSAAVRMTWRTHKELLRTSRPFWEAFQAILNELCTRMDSVALQIRTEAADFVGTRT